MGASLYCIKCNGTNVRSIGSTSTLVGGDPRNNHVWERLVCRSCSATTCRETKGGNVWYTETNPETKRNVVLAGVPSCFEDYELTCARCEGSVLRKYLDRDGSEAQCLSTNMLTGEKSYTTHYECQSCGHGGQTPTDYWSPKG